jgi:mono/diheme cytochrome c family protein
LSEYLTGTLKGLSRFVTVLLAALPMFSSVPAVAQTKTVSGDAKKGREIYNRDGCYECHGTEGQGSVLSGPRVGPDPMPLSGLVNYVRQPRGQMPPYTRKVMSDAELADIYAFLLSLPKPADAKEIPILKMQAK